MPTPVPPPRTRRRRPSWSSPTPPPPAAAAADRIADGRSAPAVAPGPGRPRPGHRRDARCRSTPGSSRSTRRATLSFADVTTYNLDEYYPISPLDPNSYRAYMHRHLFAPRRPRRRTGPTSSTAPSPRRSPPSTPPQFDRWIAADGGLDLQLLGIGRNGHIGFNEPSDLPVERGPGAADPAGRPPPGHPRRRRQGLRRRRPRARRALTLGVAPILSARAILVLAFGANKAEAVARSLRGPDHGEVPGSLLADGGRQGDLDARRGGGGGAVEGMRG